MAENDIFKRAIEAGLNLTEISRARATEFVKKLVQEGHVRQEEANQFVEKLAGWSQRQLEAIAEVVRKEVNRQVKQMRLVRMEDLQERINKISERISALRSGGAAKKAPATKASAKKAPAKKAPAKKAAGNAG
jgi:polyhydroxyalkanoate synthesis regulator phasin